MSEKPFWEGKTLMEIQNLDKRVKVTMENGDVFIGKLVRRSRDADGMCSLSMQLDAHRTYLHVFSAESFDTQPVIPSYVDTVELLDDPSMSVSTTLKTCVKVISSSLRTATTIRSSTLATTALVPRSV